MAWKNRAYRAVSAFLAPMRSVTGPSVKKNPTSEPAEAAVCGTPRLPKTSPRPSIRRFAKRSRFAYAPSSSKRSVAMPAAMARGFPRQGAGLKHAAVGGEAVHDLGRPAEGADREAAADHLAQSRDVRQDSLAGLGA